MTRPEANRIVAASHAGAFVRESDLVAALAVLREPAAVTRTTPGARVALKPERYRDQRYRVGTVVGLDSNPHRPYPLTVSFDGDPNGDRCVYPADLDLIDDEPAPAPAMVPQPCQQQQASAARPSLEVVREYDFPGCTLRIYRDRTCREFPKWCAQINVVRSRAYVAEALCLLRKYRRAA